MKTKMTLKEFLAQGYLLEVGDVVKFPVTQEVITEDDIIDYNIPTGSDNDIYIIRAKALEKQEKKVRKIDDNKTAEQINEEYDRGMREAMKKIALSCGKKFAVDIGYEQLPALVDELINDKKQEESKVQNYKYEKVELTTIEIMQKMLDGERFYNEDGTNDFGIRASMVFMDGNERPFTFNQPFYRRVKCEWWDNLDALSYPVVMFNECTGSLSVCYKRDLNKNLSNHYGFKHLRLATKTEIQQLLDNAPEG